MPRLSPDEGALLKAVCRSPADDLPRLVYADWLEEHDRPERAEFIRLQIEAERDTARSGRWEREGRIVALRRDYGLGWLRELPKWALSRYDLAGGRWPTFHRGFVSEFELVAAPFLRYGPQLLGRTPVQRLRLVELRRLIGELTGCVWLREVPRLSLTGEPLGNAGAAILAESEWLAGTRELDLSATDIGDLGVRCLARCRHLTGLRSLGLRRNALSLAAIRFLAASPFLTRVERFELGGILHLHAREDEVVRLLGERVLWH